MKKYLIAVQDNFYIVSFENRQVSFLSNMKKLLFPQTTFASGEIGLKLTNEVMVVNYNYTSTFDYYLKEYPHDDQIQQIHIHGRLDEPENIIFGYGHIEGEDYDRIKSQRLRETHENLKRFNYPKESNNDELNTFLSKDIYEVRIIGHSCGESDRTTLRRIFDNVNCHKITIAYYEEIEYLHKYRDVLDHSSSEEAIVNKVQELPKSPKFPVKLDNDPQVLGIGYEFYWD